MGALTLGLIAALCWGLHDICVRKVSQSTPLMAALLVVLVAGTVFQVTVMGATQAFAPVRGAALGYAMLSGAFFLVASLGLYAAFKRGPVKLVAPIIASYPILSVGWALLGGTPVSLAQWVAVFMIVLGVSLVAALSADETATTPAEGRTIVYALVASVGFAGTFATGQLAASLSEDLPVILIARLVAIAALVPVILAQSLPLWPGRQALPVLAMMGALDGIALICVLSAGGLPNAQFASVASSMFGLLTVVMAWAFLKERMTGLQWGGVALSFAGIGYLAV